MLNNQISIVFYDVTTLYFEIEQEDELRRTGFSKDGKHQNPQIILGFLVSVDGYPLAYDVFDGKQFEGHTLMPVIEGFKQRYGLALKLMNGQSGSLIIDEHCKLIVTYSDSRAKKNAANRKRGIEKLERSIQNGKLTKSNIKIYASTRFIEASF